MPSEALTVFQYGKETTRGTAVAAAKKLMVERQAVPVDRKPELVEDALGVKARGARVRTDELYVESNIVVPQAYFQCLPLFFSCGVKGGITASEVTPSQQDYLWTYAPSMTAANNPDTVTGEWADDVQEYEAEFLMFKSIKLSGSIPQDGSSAPVKIDAAYFARQIARSSVTAGLSIPTMTTINGKLARLYKDTTWAGRGTTELTNILRDYELEVLTGNHAKFFGSGQQYFDDFGEDAQEAMLTLTLEGTAAVNSTLHTDFQAGTFRAYSLKLNGPQIGTGTVHNFTANIWGFIEAIEPMSQRVNGNNLTKVLIHGLYDTTGATVHEYKITTNSNTI